MGPRHRRALDLLMSRQPHEVAEEMGVTLVTIERWMGSGEFRDALREREREQKRSLARLARQAAVRAARVLCDSASESAKLDAKLLLEIVKASGAFASEADDDDGGLDEMIRLALDGKSIYDADGQ
jgi:hypothetical protein